MFVTTVAAAIVATITPPAAPAAAAPAAAASPSAPKAETANPRVCVVDTITGSRLLRRSCKRLDAWRAEGVDPLAKR